MNNYGFVRIASAVPEVRVADVKFNCEEIIKAIKEADSNQAYAVLFPELCITGYSCQDLFLTDTLIKACENGLNEILEKTKKTDIIAVLGLPVFDGIHLYNCGAVIQKGKILGVVPKTFLPNYGEFYEKRWFMPASERVNDVITLCGEETPFTTDIIFKTPDFNFAIEICEDMWTACSPAAKHAVNGADVIFNPSAFTSVVGKDKHAKDIVKAASFKQHCVYVLVSSGYGESTTDALFSGQCVTCENGGVVMENTPCGFETEIFYADVDIERIRSDRRKTTSFTDTEFTPYQYAACAERTVKINSLTRKISYMPFVPSNDTTRSQRMEQVFMIQARSLAKRLKHIGCKNPVIGISGGLDSTLALLVTAKAMDLLKLDRKNIIAVTMPGFGTTGRTYNNSVKLIEQIGATFKEISIKEACVQHFKDIGQDENHHDIAYENSQARERTQILMDISNQVGGIVIGTGDLSEMALGWATYGGDHISMYCVNCGVPKTLVRHLTGWLSENFDYNLTDLLCDILDTPVSPELLPADDNDDIAQKTEDIIGDYVIHDFILYYFLRFGFSPEKILYLATVAFNGMYSEEQLKKCAETFFKRFFNNHFKRSCVPDGPKVGSVTLSPRADFKMPSDASFDLWEMTK